MTPTAILQRPALLCLRLRVLCVLRGELIGFSKVFGLVWIDAFYDAVLDTDKRALASFQEHERRDRGPPLGRAAECLGPRQQKLQTTVS